MMDIVLVVLFCWLFFKAVGLAFRVAWGAVKFVAVGLLVLAVPLLILLLMAAGGALLLIPVALMVVAFGLLAQCI